MSTYIYQSVKQQILYPVSDVYYCLGLMLVVGILRVQFMLLQLLGIGRRFWFGFLLFLVVGAGLVMLFIRSSEPAVAQVSLYYPETCLGGWQQPKAAAHEPDADGNEVSRGVSVYDNNGASIFCGEFTGALPPQTYHTRVTLRFDWHQPLPDVRIDETEQHEGDVTKDVPESVIEDLDKITEQSTSTVLGSSNDAEIATTTGVDIDVIDTNGATSSDEVFPVNDGVSTTSTSSVETTTDSLGNDAMNPDDEVIVTEPEEVQPEAEPEIVVPEEPVSVFEDDSADGSDVEVNDEVVPEEATSLRKRWFDFMIPTVFAETTAIANSDEVLNEPESEPENVVTDPSEMGVVDISTTTNEILSLGTPSIASSTEQTEQVAATSSEEVFPAETIFAVQYTLDGEVWETLGYVTTITSDVRFEFPKSVFTSVSDISLVQIALVPQLLVDTISPVYLDAMWLEVGYAPVRELGVHTISAIEPSVVPFASLIEFPSDDLAGAELAEATSTATTSVLVPLFTYEAFTESISSVHGVDDRYVVVTVAMSATSTEVWLFDMRQELIHRIGIEEATIGQYPVGVKDDMIFWLNNLDEVVFVYDLRTAGQLHEMALVANLPSANEHRLTFPFPDWEVIWRSDQFYFYTKATGEVFQDENTESAQLFYDFFNLEQLLPRVRLDEIGGIVIPDSE